MKTISTYYVYCLTQRTCRYHSMHIKFSHTISRLLFNKYLSLPFHAHTISIYHVYCKTRTCQYHSVHIQFPHIVFIVQHVPVVTTPCTYNFHMFIVQHIPVVTTPCTYNFHISCLSFNTYLSLPLHAHTISTYHVYCLTRTCHYHSMHTQIYRICSRFHRAHRACSEGVRAPGKSRPASSPCADPRPSATDNLVTACNGRCDWIWRRICWRWSRKRSYGSPGPPALQILQNISYKWSQCLFLFILLVLLSIFRPRAINYYPGMILMQGNQYVVVLGQYNMYIATHIQITFCLC